MKKFIVLAALLAAGVAQAGGYASLEYSNETNRATSADNIKEAVVIGNKVGDTDYSLKMENSQTEFGSGSISQGMEVRVKQSFGDKGGIRPYLGLRLGEKVTSSTHFSHYAIDAGVKIPLGAGFTGDVGARYRDAFDTSNNYTTQRAHLAVGYELTKQDSIAVRWSRSWGDEEKDAVRLQYTRSF
jgi:hypothetical protein